MEDSESATHLVSNWLQCIINGVGSEVCLTSGTREVDFASQGRRKCIGIQSCTLRAAMLMFEMTRTEIEKKVGEEKVRGGGAVNENRSEKCCNCSKGNYA